MCRRAWIEERGALELESDLENIQGSCAKSVTGSQFDILMHLQLAQFTVTPALRLRLQ